MVLFLTQIERDRFASYLEQEAESDDALVVQLEKIGPKGLATKYRTESLAAKIIVAKLRMTHDESLSG